MHNIISNIKIFDFLLYNRFMIVSELYSILKAFTLMSSVFVFFAVYYWVVSIFLWRHSIVGFIGISIKTFMNWILKKAKKRKFKIFLSKEQRQWVNLNKKK